VVGVRGQTASSNVAITGSAPTDNLASGGFVINYPTNFLGVTTDVNGYATGVTISGFMASQGFTLIAYCPPANPGQVNVGFYNSNGQLLNDGTPPLFTVPFNVLPTAPNGVAPVTFGAGSNLNSGGLVLTPVNGSVVILGYNWIGGTPGHVSDWSVTTNWDANIDPNAAGSTVIFGNAGVQATVLLNAGNRTIGTMDFNSSTPTTITTTLADAGTLTFDNGASDAAINVSGSGHNITSLVGVMLNNDLDIAVNNNGDNLTIAGNITDGANGPMGLTKSGAGKLTLSGNNTYGGDTTVTGGVLKVTSASALPDGGNLTIGATALTMFSATVPAAPVAIASAITKADSATSGNMVSVPVAQAVQSGPHAGSNAAANGIAATANPTPWFITPTIATGPRLPGAGMIAKAHDAAIQSWSSIQLTKNLSWLAASYNLNNQSDSKYRSANAAAVDEAVLRYST
jgi:autotransporter-associated beta strand protein